MYKVKIHYCNNHWSFKLFTSVGRAYKYYTEMAYIMKSDSLSKIKGIYLEELDENNNYVIVRSV